MTKDELKKQVAEVLSGMKEHENTLKARISDLQSGDVIVFKGLDNIPEDMDLSWVLLNRNPDHPDFHFTIPADSAPMVGTNDMEIPIEADGGPMVLRLGHGKWLKKAVLETGIRVSFIDEFHTQRAMSVIARIIRCSWEPSLHQKETEQTVDYEEWMKKVVGACVSMDRYIEQMAELVTKEHVNTHTQTSGKQKLSEVFTFTIISAKDEEVIRIPRKEFLAAGNQLSIPNALMLNDKVMLGTVLVKFITNKTSGKTTIFLQGPNSNLLLKNKPKITIVFYNGHKEDHIFEESNGWEIPYTKSPIKSIALNIQSEE